LGGGKENREGGEREREREMEREKESVSVTPVVPRVGIPGLGCCLTENA
jgi:hypothetical protein